MLLGLSTGLTLESMREMRMCDVANILGEYKDMQPSAPDEDGEREATQGDINWLKSL